VRRSARERLIEFIGTVTTAPIRWPAGLDRHTLCFTIDVEWAAPEVLDDLRGLFDQFGIRATFFITHAGVEVPGHERGLHPNFRRDGDTIRLFHKSRGSDANATDEEIHQHVMETTLTFAPESKGLRTHSLYYDSTLLPLYKKLGLEYDCSYQMPMVQDLRPFWRPHDVIAIPTYFADHFDIMCSATQFEVDRLGLDRPGIKVFDFHPNIIYLNASSNAHYMATKGFYHDHERLLADRERGKGARTLLLDLLEAVSRRQLPNATVGEVNTAWRSVTKWQ
jgi:hypothetical protein